MGKNDDLQNIYLEYNSTNSKEDFFAKIEQVIGGQSPHSIWEWFVIPSLDCDDAMTPGYWNHVADLIHSSSFSTAGAGVVGTKFIPVVETTPEKCQAGIEGNKKMVKSQGISMIYRRDIFTKLGSPYKIGPHGTALG